ncbi:hypothetical protein BDW67DRAFT_80850 [Aspergillus spinulosporus]
MMRLAFPSDWAVLSYHASVSFPLQLITVTCVAQSRTLYSARSLNLDLGLEFGVVCKLTTRTLAALFSSLG